ncbi:hypothetical protein OG963_04535 [Streptomyces sp. NBC_01707]|nr:hypothetical protein [Streptomyces sp. AK08-01B]MDX3772413.1 hypothetical protein [Streptomyces sp. AK08-01B]
MGRKKVGPAEIDTGLLTGSWRRLVLSAPHLEPGTVDWKAYTFCVLEQLHRMLRSKQVFARNSSKWSDPRAFVTGSVGPTLAVIDIRYGSTPAESQQRTEERDGCF